MENSILKQDYETEQAVFARYTAAKASGDLSQQEAARSAHRQLAEQVAARGGCYSRLYRMYRDAMECGNSDLDIDDLTQEADIPGLWHPALHLFFHMVRRGPDCVGPVPARLYAAGHDRSVRYDHELSNGCAR